MVYHDVWYGIILTRDQQGEPVAMLTKIVFACLKWVVKWIWLVLVLFGLQQTVVSAKLSGSLTEEAIATRLQPTGKVTVIQADGAPVKTEAATAAATGPAKTFQDNCKMCHQTGLAGAPKYGNKADWAPRVAEGIDVMVEKAFNGFKGMPPKGNCLACSKDDIKKTIEYMLSAIK